MQTFFNWIGLETGYVSHAERLISGAGGFLGILFILLVSNFFLDGPAAAIIVASMGASAVLLFAVPHGALSQPWSLVGGHMVSAVIGVSCAKLIADQSLAASLAVGLAIGAMHYLRCIHPPGGATALAAVVSGSGVNALGFGYILTPVALNVLVILMTAIAFNYFFHWRRYPAFAKRRAKSGAVIQTERYQDISHADLVYALSEIDSFIDVTEQDLLTIYDLATSRQEPGNIDPAKIEVGKYFSNGRYGPDWSVRLVVDTAGKPEPENDMVIYKTVAGRDRRSSGTVNRVDFSRWAAYEVVRNENSWQRA